MPTTHVQPSSQENLQEIANALLKARKVVVVTGAGISTNSGIPDFRSENGLYSLIQAQFDAAARQARLAEQEVRGDQDKGDFDNGRENKRRRLSCDNTTEPETKSEATEEEIQVRLEHESTQSDSASSNVKHEDQPQQHPEDANNVVDSLPVITTRRRTRQSLAAAQPVTSPLSSPPPDDLVIPPTAFRKHRHSHLSDVRIPPSSPLSSPPPVLFDPFEPSSPSAENASRRSTSPSEVDDSSNTINVGSSQASQPNRTTLPNMKGKDLFDASIWSDPLRTSVFYTFATTLRQKVKDIQPTSSHRFISHLRDRGKLVRCYTQNIDQIEEKVGLSTSLKDGPGSRGRFSRRSTANSSVLNKMVEEASNTSAEQSPSDKTQQTSDSEPSQQSQGLSDGTETPANLETEQSSDAAKPPPKNARRELPRSGVECVFLHGSLELLRCFLCGRVSSWDDAKELETMSGQQPECPHCVGATTAREERGKRALGVGKLRPDIVLYGEEHPNSHLISPIVTHDLALNPDLLLILGTSLRVHGLKVMVREFAKAVHTKGGKVVFVNFTKPPESSWGDIIDYWIEWDCDAWVADLQDKVPKLWKDPEPPKPKKKRESTSASTEGEKAESKKPPPANPVALRDTKVTGAYWTLKIMNELHRITGTEQPDRRASISIAPAVTTAEGPLNVENKITKPRGRRPRKSAPGVLERAKKPSSTLNPNHGRSRQKPPAGSVESAETVTPSDPIPTTEPAPAMGPVPAMGQTSTPVKPVPVVPEPSSIIDSVKSNPRRRKRKKIDGEEVVMPTVGRRRTAPEEPKRIESPGLHLPPLKPQPPSSAIPRYGKPMPLEPTSPPAGPPLAQISVNMRTENGTMIQNPFYIDDPLVRHFTEPASWRQVTRTDATIVIRHEGNSDETDAILALTGLKRGNPTIQERPDSSSQAMNSDLRRWGASWLCKG